MGMKQTETFAGAMVSKEPLRVSRINVLMIQRIMKNGMKRIVRRVIMASRDRPKQSMPTKLIIQNSTKPASPYFRSKGTWKALLRSE